MMVCTVFNRGSLLKWFISGRLLSRLKTLPNLGPSEFNQAARTYGEYDPCEFAVQAEPTRVSVTRSPFAIKMIDQKCMPGAGRINPTKKS